MCCLLVLDSVTSTPQWIRQPKPRDVFSVHLCEREGGREEGREGGRDSGYCTLFVVSLSLCLSVSLSLSLSLSLTHTHTHTYILATTQHTALMRLLLYLNLFVTYI